MLDWTSWIGRGFWRGREREVRIPYPRFSAFSFPARPSLSALSPLSARSSENPTIAMTASQVGLTGFGDTKESAV